MPRRTKATVSENPIETLPPEQSARVIGNITTSLASIKHIAAQEKLPRRVVNKMIEDLKERYAGTEAALREFNDAQVAKAIGDKALMIIESIDEFDVAMAPLRDKAVAAGVLIDKKQLLEEKPTAILTIEDRRKINELVPELVKEARRRGIALEGDFKDVTPTKSEME